MKVEIKPSDLQYLYHRNQQNRDLPRFTGLPDPRAFDRDDIYEVIPMLEAVMAALESRDGEVLQACEKLMIFEMPKFLTSREEVFNCLFEVMSERLGRSRA